MRINNFDFEYSCAVIGHHDYEFKAATYYYLKLEFEFLIIKCQVDKFYLCGQNKFCDTALIVLKDLKRGFNQIEIYFVDNGPKFSSKKVKFEHEKAILEQGYDSIIWLDPVYDNCSPIVLRNNKVIDNCLYVVFYCIPERLNSDTRTCYQYAIDNNRRCANVFWDGHK